MRQLKQLFLIVLALTFVGGIGTGAWIGTLLAAPPKPGAKLERRVEDFKHYFPDLDATQERQLRTVLADYDHKKDRIKATLTPEQLRRIRTLEDSSRERIRLLLTEPQRSKYDKLVGSR
ncbi:MAG: hypothetical protein ACYTG3_05400 [Planctomycetota bacterium]|jgi:hypothetical protein